MFGTGPDNGFDVIGAFSEDDAVRKLSRQIGRRMGVLLAKRLAGLKTLPEGLLEDAAFTSLIAMAILLLVFSRDWLGDGSGFVQTEQRWADRAESGLGDFVFLSRTGR
jgi:hypothetical protein